MSVALFVGPHFSAFHVAIPCLVFSPEVFLGPPLFSFKVCAEGAQKGPHGLGLEPQWGLEALAEAHIVIIPGWHDPSSRPSDALIAALRACRARGARIVGLCLGAYVLAYAGLLNGQEATTHWEYAQDFAERFPAVSFKADALYVNSDRLTTSAGVTAGLDCCLAIVREYCGSAAANKIAQRLVLPAYREGGQAQLIEKPVPSSSRDTRINDLLELLRRNLATPCSLDAMARHVHMSRRTLTRSFYEATGMTVSQWLLAERLQRSQVLLETSGQSIETIAESVGFGSAASLRTNFRKVFGVAPREWRRDFGIESDD